MNVLYGTVTFPISCMYVEISLEAGIVTAIHTDSTAIHHPTSACGAPSISCVNISAILLTHLLDPRNIRSTNVINYRSRYCVHC